MSINKDTTNSTRMKKIRKKIKLSKANGDQELMFKHLQEFQQLHIDNDFTFGVGEIYRYSKTLAKLGFIKESIKQQQIVDEAVFSASQKFKDMRCKQLASFLSDALQYRFKFRCDNPEAPSECQSLNGEIEPAKNSGLFVRYKSCKNRPRCYCTVTASVRN